MSDLKNLKSDKGNAESFANASGGSRKITFRQIIAWIAILLLVGMYVLTLMFSLMDSPLAQQMFHASLYCTVFIPVISWVFIMTVKLVKGNGNDESDDEK